MSNSWEGHGRKSYEALEKSLRTEFTGLFNLSVQLQKKLAEEPVQPEDIARILEQRAQGIASIERVSECLDSYLKRPRVGVGLPGREDTHLDDLRRIVKHILTIDKESEQVLSEMVAETETEILRMRKGFAGLRGYKQSTQKAVPMPRFRDRLT